MAIQLTKSETILAIEQFATAGCTVEEIIILAKTELVRNWTSPRPLVTNQDHFEFYNGLVARILRSKQLPVRYKLL